MVSPVMIRPVKVERAPAFVLHSYDYRDTSLIVELWTAQWGRLGVVARGARRNSSPWRGVLVPFQPLLVGWSGKGDLKTLNAVDNATLYPVLAGRALATAYYLNEIILRTCMRLDPQPRLFKEYMELVQRLDGAELEPRLRYFEKNLLQELGFIAPFDFDSEGDPVEAGLHYCYQEEVGAVPVSRARDGQVLGNGLSVSGSVLLALQRETLEPGQFGEAKRMMKQLLTPHLGSKPLQSRKIWAALARSGTPATQDN